MLRLFGSYVAVLVVMIAGDALWLSWFARAVFRPTLGSLLLDDPRWAAAAAFYLLYALAIVVFPVTLAARSEGWTGVLIYGALFGLFAYMTYDLTNLATLKPWTATLALADIAWGAILSAAAATAGRAASVLWT